MRRCVLLLVVAVLAAGCSSAAPPSTTAPAGSTTLPAVVATTATAVPTTAPAAPAATAVLALASGRGDDGSLEVAVWGDGDFAAAGSAVMVGVDSDDSYPGVGDVRPHLDGFVLLTSDGSGLDAVVSSAGEVVADAATAPEWVFWVVDAGVLRIFFVQDVALRAGSVWVSVEVGGQSSPLGTAGVPLGDACSYRGSGVEVNDPPGEVPDPGRTCAYP